MCKGVLHDLKMQFPICEKIKFQKAHLVGDISKSKFPKFGKFWVAARLCDCGCQLPADRPARPSLARCVV